MRASVIIPTWNGRDLLLHTLRSLELQTMREFEVIVVDNGSTDGTAARVAADFPHVRVMELPENRGFAAAVNVGIAAARAPVLALLNNDTEAAPHWLEALLRTLDAQPEVAAATSRMLDFDDRTRVDSVGVQLGLFASNIAHGRADGPEYDRLRHVFAACAGAAAYRRSVLDQVGHFDESFFAYCEDVDLGARIRLLGHDCVYVPDAVVYHRGSMTANRVPDMKFYLLMRNALTLFFRYMPASRMVWAPAMLAWPFVRAMLDGQRQRTALRAVRDFARDLPRTLRIRRQWQARRRISSAEFAELLASPFAQAGTEPRLLAGRRALAGRVPEGAVRT